MTDRPLTTGEGNTADEAARRLLAIDDALHRHAEGATAFKRTDVRLVCEALAECRQALEEACDVSQDEVVKLREQLDAATAENERLRLLVIAALERAEKAEETGAPKDAR